MGFCVLSMVTGMESNELKALLEREEGDNKMREGLLGAVDWERTMRRWRGAAVFGIGRKKEGK